MGEGRRSRFWRTRWHAHRVGAGNGIQRNAQGLSGYQGVDYQRLNNTTQDKSTLSAHSIARQRIFGRCIISKMIFSDPGTFSVLLNRAFKLRVEGGAKHFQRSVFLWPLIS
jgi:hypothetical protein